MKKKNKIYSPFLSIYKPQIGSLVSILERITGITLTVVLVVSLCLYYLKNSLLLEYTFYTIFFIIFKGAFFLVDTILIFIILNFVYHVYFLPVIYKRYNAVYGKINDYHVMPYTDIVNKLSFSSLLVVLLSIVLYYII